MFGVTHDFDNCFLIALFSLPKARAKNLLEERKECPHYDSFMCSDHPFVSSRVTTNPAEDDAPSIRRRVDRHGNGDVNIAIIIFLPR